MSSALEAARELVRNATQTPSGWLVTESDLLELSARLEDEQSLSEAERRDQAHAFGYREGYRQAQREAVDAFIRDELPELLLRLGYNGAAFAAEAVAAKIAESSR